MKTAVLISPFRIEIKEINAPSPRENEVLVKVKATCVCGSDLHAYRGTHPFRKPPVVLGHEVAGKVEKVGEGVKEFQPGDRVTVEPWTHCGRCIYCTEGRYNLCLNKQAMGTGKWQGSFAEYVVAPEYVVYRIPDSISYEEGALVEPLAVGVHALRQARVELGQSVAILGAGPIGLAALICSRKAGAARLIVSDIEDFNLNIARKLGASKTVNVKNESLQEIVNEATMEEGVDITVIAAGEKELVSEAIKVVKKGGKIVVPAIFEGTPEVDMFQIVSSEQNIQGTWAYTRKDFNTAIDFLALKKVNLTPLITHSFSLNQADKAFDILNKKSEKIVKIQFVF